MRIRDLKAEARQSLRRANKNPRLLTLYFVLCAEGVTILFNLLSVFLYTFNASGLSNIGQAAALTSVTVFISLIVNIAITIWSNHYCNYSVKLSRGRETSFLDFVAPFRIFGSTLLAMLLVFLKALLATLICTIPLAILISLITLTGISTLAMILAIAGYAAMLVYLYSVIYRYYFVFHALYDGNGCAAGIALKRSEILTKGVRWTLFKLDLSFLWYTIPMMLPIMIVELLSGDFALLIGYSMPLNWVAPATMIATVISAAIQVLFMPYMETTKAVAYNHLLRQYVPAPQTQEPAAQPELLPQQEDTEEPPQEFL